MNGKELVALKVRVTGRSARTRHILHFTLLDVHPGVERITL